MKKLIAIVVAILCTACSVQKTQPRKVFDIKTFDKNKNYLNRFTDTLENGIIIEQRERREEYYEVIKSREKYFQEINRYYKNGKLKLNGLYFDSNFKKGIWREYDEEGNLIEETDYDKEFEFTWEQLLKIFEERNVDIRDADNTTIRKQNGNWRFDYIQDIYIYDVIIHGKTGKVLQDAKNVFQEGS